ncbi:MAG: hypothetical protein J6C11_08365 [Spirochaetaceae bacterium]|nr:hypothetical protein [Spirochaetaceae bacterium]MBQ8384387.1 hypothetical protein [Spirochaetaceae bacterium]MBQ8560552.1 hypothetical protein [Spirochaetaceae bacterium]MBR2463310.1 hypothetical protein [Spirochaetaceae bacterium]
MSIDRKKEIADQAEVIINGYAVIKNDIGMLVVNLNADNASAVFDRNDEMLETSMDDIDLAIAHDYLIKSKKYMES